MTASGVIFLVAAVAAAWEAFSSRSPGWAGVALIALGLGLSQM
jgi:hypothetical protein